MNTKEQILDNQKLEDGYYWVRYVDDEKPNWVILALRANKWCVPGTWQHMHTPDIISERILSPAETAPSLPYVGWVEGKFTEKEIEQEASHSADKWYPAPKMNSDSSIDDTLKFNDVVLAQWNYMQGYIAATNKYATQYPAHSGPDIVTLPIF